MRKSLVRPINKGGPSEICSNYRPVALTNHLIKLMERCVRKGIVHFLEIKKLFDDSQHGARKGRSTLTQLLEQQDQILKMLLEGKNVEALFLDYE